MLVPVSHVVPLATIRRERNLPVSGRVMVRQGQKVNPTDTIAEALIAPEHIILDIGKGLGLPAEKADQYIQKSGGEYVSEGDVIAGPIGITRRVVRAPRAGQVVLTGNGQVLLELESPPFKIVAGMHGIVISLTPERGATIENTGALVQGVWGNGQVDFGMMRVLMHKAEDILTIDQLDPSLRGAMIVAGFCGDEDTLHAVAELPARGLILGSMPSSLTSHALKMKFPIIILEGFGLLPLNSAAFNLLSANQQREISINAEPLERYGINRPEIIIPLPANGEPPQPLDMVSFAPDQRVRILRAPYKSRVGKVVSIRPGLHEFPNKLRAQAAEIRLENGENVLMPVANIEVLV